jgi:hypothetical protein
MRRMIIRGLHRPGGACKVAGCPFCLAALTRRSRFDELALLAHIAHQVELAEKARKGVKR